jgi:serine/threonine-protein kinase
VATRSSPERFRRADALFDAALDLPPGERARYVEHACAGDPLLAADVRQLLRAHELSSGFLERPVLASSSLTLERLRRAVGDRYVVEREIGAGGMATVFLAHDRRHDRHIALKLLNPELGALLGVERFIAEIRVTAALQHPNLLPLFDSGSADGLVYYVMPFVNGETLRQRLTRERQLPVDEAIRLVSVVASALDHAHRQGVVHRDLKPENILLQDGVPLVADFGIALAVTRAGGARVTQAGISLGTPQYMSPEQAAGDRAIDARSDVYSLACVLYEMLAGDPPHTGSTVQAVIAKVLSATPRPIRELRPGVPAAVDAALVRALAKVPADRFGSANDFAQALTAVHARPVRARWRWSSARALAGAAVLGAAAWLSFVAARRESPRPPITRFTIETLNDPTLGGIAAQFALSTDGRRVVYHGSAANRGALMMRSLGELHARVIPGTQSAFNPTISPDGKWVAYFTGDDKLAKVPIEGGAPIVLAPAFRFLNAAWWGVDHLIVEGFGGHGLVRVSASAPDVPHPLTELDAAHGEERHANPLVLSGGKSIVFTIIRERDGPRASSGELATAALDPAHPELVARHRPLGVQARQPIAFMDGWLFFVGPDGDNISAVRFDAGRGSIAGRPVRLLDVPEGGLESAALAANGTLVYMRRRADNEPVVVSRDGKAQKLAVAGAGSFMNPRLSPDGRRLVLQVGNGRGNDAWVYDLVSGTPVQLTATGNVVGPTWLPDGKRVVYLSSGDGSSALWVRAADGSGAPEKIAEGELLFAAAAMPDGRSIFFQQHAPEGWQIWMAALDGAHAPRAVVREHFDVLMPAPSPDGHWLAYVSNASGTHDVFVRPFPQAGAAVRVSDGGGDEPGWSRDGKQLFYRGNSGMMAATITTSPQLAVLRRERLFADRFDGQMPHRNYDVAPDGRFFMVMTDSTVPPEHVVILNWLDEARSKLR